MDGSLNEEMEAWLNGLERLWPPKQIELLREGWLLKTGAVRHAASQEELKTT